MSDGLSDGDRTWLETRFKALEDKIVGQATDVGDLKLKVLTLELGSPHRCTEEIKKHEAGSWSHNPYKASGLIAGILGAVEAAKKIFSGH
jgi:hypothetical protein